MILATYFKVPSIDDLLKIAPNLKLVLFDMDGTLVDSEKEHAMAVLEVIKSHVKVPFNFQDVFNLVFGCPDPYSYEALKANYSLTLSLEDFLHQKHEALEKVLTQNIKKDDLVLKEIKGLLESIKSHHRNISLAVVTASERKTAKSVLNSNFKDVFPLYFGREDTVLSKPFPDPYFNALKIMGEQFGPFNHDEVLLVEDSPYGLASAMASGLRLIKATWYSKK